MEALRQGTRPEPEIAGRISPGLRLTLAILVLILHVGLLGAAWRGGSALTDDSIQYLRLADNWVEQGVFSQAYGAPYVPDLQRTPGYPALLVALGRQVPLVLLFQHMLTLLSALLVWRILKGRVPDHLAEIGGWLYALMPYPAIFASMVLSETLFIAVLLVAVWQLLDGLEGPRWRALVAGMGWLALAALVRPVALPLLYLALAFLLWRCLRRPEFRRPALLLALVLPVALLLPWMLRNGAIGGRATLSVMDDMGMLHGRLGGLAAYRDRAPLDELTLYRYGDSLASAETGLPGLRAYYAPHQAHETELYPAAVRGITWRYFAAHPIDALLFTFRNLTEMFKGVGHGWALALTRVPKVAAALASWQGILNAAMFICALFGLRLWRQLPAWWWTCAVAVGAVLLTSAAAWADGRYRVVVDPLLLLMAVWTFAALTPWLNRRVRTLSAHIPKRRGR
jgi:Dolichyl-phosphate-mannose-protein mannosyltransferase